MSSPSPSTNDPKGLIGTINAVRTPLGFFALVVLVTEGILGGLAFRATGNDFTLLVIGMLVILILLIVAVTFTRPRTPDDSHRTDAPAGVAIRPAGSLAVVDKRLEDRLRQIRTNVQLAAKRNNPIFTCEISNEINDLVVESANWSRGELDTSVQRYNSVLLALYGHAKESIFSTTIRDFLAEWPTELMEEMIKASETSQARSVTRVFVFAKRTEIDEWAIQVLKRFVKSSKIKSLVYIDSEDFRFNFPPDLSRDFVVIDGGDAIGVTTSYGQRNLRAVWYFADEDRKHRFQRTCDGLTNGSETAEEILKWWDNLSHSANGQAL